MRTQLPVLATLVLMLATGGTLAGAAGTGTFSLSNATVAPGQVGTTNLSLNASWDPPASEILLNLRYDPAVIRFEGARFLVGGTTSATRIQPGTVLVQVVDLTAGLGNGTIAEVGFAGLENGSSRLGIDVERVRAHPDGRPVEITDSASTAPGLFTVRASPAANATAVSTPTPSPAGTPAPTPPPSLPTLRPTIPATPPPPPTTMLYGDDYTGAVTSSPTPGAAIPRPGRTIAGVVAANPGFSRFLDATRAAGLCGALEGTGPLTAFVPTDAAFDALPPGAVEDLLANRTVLEAVVRYHLAPGSLSVAEATARGEVPTLLGVPLRVAVRPGGTVGIDGANLTLLDIPAANGMVHVVDGVLVPPGLTLGPVLTPTPSPTPSPSPPTSSPTRAGCPGLLAAGVLAVAAAAVLRRR